MTAELSIVEKLAAVYAEAVLTLLDAGEEQWILWDAHSNRFDFTSTALDDPELPILLTIDADWEKQLGGVNAETDPDADDYDVNALRGAIEHTLIDEGVGERILKDFADQLESTGYEHEDEDDDEDEDEDEEPDEDYEDRERD